MGNASSISSVLPTSPPKTPCTSSSGKKKNKSDDDSNSNNNNMSNATISVPSSAQQAAESATERARKLLGDAQETFKTGVKRLEEQDHPAGHLIDSLCGPYLDGHDDGDGGRRRRRGRRRRKGASFYSDDIDSDEDLDEDLDEDDSRRTISEDDQTMDTEVRDQDKSTVASSSIVGPVTSKKEIPPSSMDGSSFMSHSDYESQEEGARRGGTGGGGRKKKHAQDGSAGKTQQMQLLNKPLASSFAKRCYFTKAGIGKTTQHYEGLTLTGNVVLMLASAMKLKGCPTICDEDLRRVEQTYPNQFSRLPDELLLSSGWRRISKYCHFSNKPIPDGIPFFHSKQRLHPQGGYYFLLAAAVGMVRPIDVEPLTRDTLVLLETDYPTQCDAAPDILIQDPNEWTLVNKFCFFSGGPINTEEDVYYQADFDGNPIYMLAFLSPSLTPEELYKLEGDAMDENTGMPIPGLTSVAAVEEVESVYDLTERDFHDLKLYHLGPCRALPQYILQPHAWTKVLPPHFLEARHQAILRAQDYEMRNGGPPTPMAHDPITQRTQQLTVGAAPVDGGRYDVYDPQQQQQHHQFQHHHHQQQHQPGLGGGLNIPGTSPGEYGGQEGSYYMQQQAAMGVPNTYEGSFGPQPEQQHQYEHEHQHQHPDDKYHPHHQFQRHPNSPYSPERAMMHEGYNYREDEEDDDIRSGNYRRENEEGVFVDENVAPEDEAWHHHHQRMDPPEDGPMSPDNLHDSMASGNPHNISHNSENHYGSDRRDPYVQGTYGEDAVDDDYVYSQSREDQYYDSPQVLEGHPGSQDHEFFNAPSGGNDEDDEMGFDPDHVVSSFDPEGYVANRHPDDPMFNEVYYDDDDEGSAEYSAQPQSPPAINADHLRRLGRRQTQPPSKSPHAMASPMSAASSQNSISEYSHSSAMRGAQELLKRNRLRRQQQARQRQAEKAVDASGETHVNDSSHYMEEEEDEEIVPTSPAKMQLDYNISPSQDESEHNSEAVTSVVSGSSVWTDSSPNTNDRSSRRALILQMAKARMKSNKDRDPAESTITEEKSGLGDSYDETDTHHSMNDAEREMLRQTSAGTEFDLTADLD